MAGMGIIMIFGYGKAVAEFAATILVIPACIKYLRSK